MLKRIGNESVRLYTNPETGMEEMYVSVDLVPEGVKNWTLRVIGEDKTYRYCRAGSWNYFYPLSGKKALKHLLRTE